MKTIVKTLAVMLFGATIIVSCGSENTSADTNKQSAPEVEKTGVNKGQAFIADDGSTPNILQIAIGSPDHTTLVAAVQAAELENALVNAGPLTVFAPTNAAFAALPEGTVEFLVKPENKATLADILKFHVTPGKYAKDFLPKLKKLGQANNQYIAVTRKDGEVYIGDAKIIASIPAGNGIVHVIDKVLTPPSK